MSQRIRMLTIGALVFLFWAVIATATTVQYYQEYASANQRYNEYYQKYTALRGSVIQVSVTIDYENGTSVKKDAIYLSPDTTVLDALKAVATINATYWTAFGSFLVNAINGIANNAGNNNRWWIYEVNGEHALVSADQYKLHDGDYVEWKYEKY